MPATNLIHTKMGTVALPSSYQKANVYKFAKPSGPPPAGDHFVPAIAVRIAVPMRCTICGRKPCEGHGNIIKGRVHTAHRNGVRRRKGKW